MNCNLLRAIFARNFASFFSSVTGYVFIFFFVFFSVGITFGLDPIYNTNLANLDVLSSVYPFTMLLLIPAITMGLWAGERRDGTDELLLTMPGSDFDIVLAKYLSAAAIYTVSLLFAVVPCYYLLNQLASPGTGFALRPAIDVGLFASTFLGYWLMGLPAIGLGMVASFLTRNLTLAWLLGTALYVPLAILIALAIVSMHVSGLFGDLTPMLAEINDSLTAPGRGTLSLLGAVFFLAVVVVAFYVCMVLIGSRHWGRRGRLAMGLHYLVRTLALVVIAACVVVWARRAETRADLTAGQLTRLAGETRQLLGDLKSDRPVVIEAFLSPDVPQGYVPTRKNIESTIREMTALAHGNIVSRIIPTAEDTEEAVLAEGYGIAPREVLDREGGSLSVRQVFLGVRVRSGLNSVTIPFIDRGIPVEYELIRSVCTVLEEKRKRVGILTTDARLYGQFDMQTMSAGRNWPVIDELEKQYKVVQVDASQPIDAADYDVLLAVQPSTLGPEQMDHFVAAVQAGLPTAIFEDPAPLLAGVTGTSQRRRAPGGMGMMMGQQSPPQGDIKKLWGLLGVDFLGDAVVQQKFNPFPRVTQFDEQPEFVFINKACAEQPFNRDDPTSQGLQQVLFPFPGAITGLNSSKLNVEPLIETGTQTGTVQVNDLMRMTPFGPSGGLNPNRQSKFTGDAYILAARIRGEVETPAPETEGDDDQPPPKPKTSKINVVLVGDIDMLSPAFFTIREQGDNPDLGIHFDFDNVTFILNVLDSLAGDNRFIAIRNRRPVHRPLARIDEQTKDARDQLAKAITKSTEKYQDAIREEQEQLNERVREIEKEMRAKNMDLMEIARRIEIVQQAGEKRVNAKIEQLERQRDREIRRARIDEKNAVSKVRVRYKLYAWFLAPVPPLLLGVFVFFRRWTSEKTHAREREKAIRARQR
ncbi:MAG: Gldg family protein [Pirellulales bacterium]|nr:Gldg family protein [Pirellulales bacterium]